VAGWPDQNIDLHKFSSLAVMIRSGSTIVDVDSKPEFPARDRK